LKDRLQFANRVLEDADALHDSFDNVGLDGPWRVEVEDADLLLLLADPVDAADPLLDLHRVPGQVVVHHSRAELEVQSFAGHPASQEDLECSGTKVPHDPPAPSRRDPTVQRAAAEGLTESSVEIPQGSPREREDNDALALPHEI